MIKLFKKWHWLHTWSPWESGEVEFASYPWTPAGYYAHTQVTQTRHCEKCHELQKRVVH